MNPKLLYSRYMAQELVRRYRTGERDFIELNLRNIHLRDDCLVDINFSGANLEEADLTGTHLINANFSHANLEKVQISYGLLINANLSHANLRNTKLINTDLTGADLTGADLTGADLSNAILVMTNLTDANLTDIKTTENTISCQTIMPNISVQSSPDIVIDAQTFLRRYAAGERIFKDIVLHRIDLSGADLREANLSKTHLSYVNFYEANLENSQFDKVISCDFRNANLSRCNFTNSQIIYSDLRGVNLAGLDMTATNFIGSNLQGAQGSFNFLDVMFFCNTTWISGEFIPGPVNADAHWSRSIIEGEF